MLESPSETVVRSLAEFAWGLPFDLAYLGRSGRSVGLAYLGHSILVDLACPCRSGHLELAYLDRSAHELAYLDCSARVELAYLGRSARVDLAYLGRSIKLKNQKQKTYKLFFTNSTKNCTSPTRNARKENSD